MKSIVRALATAAIAVAPAICVAQIVRVEVYPIQSVTMSDQDFLNGRKDPCVELGPTIAYHEKAHAAAQRAVKEFFAATLLAP